VRAFAIPAIEITATAAAKITMRLMDLCDMTVPSSSLSLLVL
jgi:hypothetical protein